MRLFTRRVARRDSALRAPRDRTLRPRRSRADRAGHAAQSGAGARPAAGGDRGDGRTRRGSRRSCDRHPEAGRQLALADLVVMTKTDLAAPGEVARVAAALRAAVPVAPIDRDVRLSMSGCCRRASSIRPCRRRTGAARFSALAAPARTHPTGAHPRRDRSGEPDRGPPAALARGRGLVARDPPDPCRDPAAGEGHAQSRRRARPGARSRASGTCWRPRSRWRPGPIRIGARASC